jgi:hypothetical protein
MRILAALVIGLLIGCLVVAGLVIFKNAAWTKTVEERSRKRSRNDENPSADVGTSPRPSSSPRSF